MAVLYVPALRDRELVARVDMLRTRFAHRDRIAGDVAAVRRGDFDKIAPNAFNEEYPRPIVANLIDVYAKHAAAALGIMPTIRCGSASMSSDAAKKRATKRTFIANHYARQSRMREQIQVGADQFYTFGLIVGEVYPDFEAQAPELLIRDCRAVYPVWDAKGRTVEVALVFTKRVVDLMAEYPEAAAALREGTGFYRGGNDRTVEVVRHVDKHRITLLCPQLDGLVLARLANPIGRCTVVATKKPSVDGEIRGAFDDLIWVQVARHEMQMLTMEAAADAVEAPFVVPTDVADVALGPKAIVRTNNPQGVSRLNLQVPTAAFAAIDHFKQEMQSGAITPEALGGSIDASVVTGQGVQELMAGYSQQVASAQETLTGWWEQLTSIALEMDQALWGDVEKTIEGHKDGTPYKVTYTPNKDINGDYSVDVNFGTATGLDPNRHLVYLLQAQGAGLYSKDTVLRQMPGEINATEELSKIQVEQGRDALMQMVAGLASSMPGLIAQGQDPSAVAQQVSAFVAGMQKGKAIEDLAEEIFAPPPPPEQDPAAADPLQAAADPMAAAMGGGGAMAPPDAGPPDLNNFFAGLSSDGAPNLGAYVSRQRAV